MSYLPKLNDISNFLNQITRSEKVAIGLFATTSTALSLIFSSVEPWSSLPDSVEVGLSLVWLFSLTSTMYVICPKLWDKWNSYRLRKRQVEAARKLTAVQKRLLAKMGVSKVHVDITQIAPRDFDCRTLIELKVAGKALRDKGLATPLMGRMHNKLKLTDQGLQRASEIHEDWKKNGNEIFVDD